MKTPAGTGFAFAGPDDVDPEFFGKGVGVALRKGDTGLLDKLDAALRHRGAACRPAATR